MLTKNLHNKILNRSAHKQTQALLINKSKPLAYQRKFKIEQIIRKTIQLVVVHICSVFQCYINKCCNPT